MPGRQNHGVTQLNFQQSVLFEEKFISLVFNVHWVKLTMLVHNPVGCDSA